MVINDDPVAGAVGVGLLTYKTSFFRYHIAAKAATTVSLFVLSAKNAIGLMVR